MVMYKNLNACVLALVAFANLFDGSGLGSAGSASSIGVFVSAAPTPMRRHDGVVHGERDSTKVRTARDDPAPSDTPTQAESTETLGRLLNDYDLLRAAIPAVEDGSDLSNALFAEINHKKEIIFQKFGQIVPDVTGAPGTDAPPTTVSSADGSVMTVIPIPGGSGIIIAQNGQNTTVSLGADQPAPTSTVGPQPTSTSTVVTVSTSTASSANAQAVATSSSTTTSASPSPSKHNGAGLLSPLDILPTTMAMKSLLTVTGAMMFGAWTVL